jgi:hypothetical protein
VITIHQAPDDHLAPHPAATAPVIGYEPLPLALSVLLETTTLALSVQSNAQPQKTAVIP